MSFVVDFVLLGGTNSVLVIWGLILYFVFCKILPRIKTVMLFALHHLHRDTSFGLQSRLSVIPY